MSTVGGTWSYDRYHVPTMQHYRLLWACAVALPCCVCLLPHGWVVDKNYSGFVSASCSIQWRKIIQMKTVCTNDWYAIPKFNHPMHVNWFFTGLSLTRGPAPYHLKVVGHCLSQWQAHWNNIACYVSVLFDSYRTKVDVKKAVFWVYFSRPKIALTSNVTTFLKNRFAPLVSNKAFLLALSNLH